MDSGEVIYVDAPLWEAHGTVFAHLISDESAAELHDFARHLGLPAGAWDGDHYDVPLSRYPDVVAAGAVVVDGHAAARLLAASGLRFRKRRGERPLARVDDAVPWLPTPHRVDILRSSMPAPDAATVAAFVVARDPAERVLLVRTTRRGEWEVPGGKREPGESVRACAVREVAEEVGLVIEEATLVPFGYERLSIPQPLPGWPYRENIVQGFAVDARPGAWSGPSAEIDAVEWVDVVECERRCQGAFWWPLLADHLGIGWRQRR